MPSQLKQWMERDLRAIYPESANYVVVGYTKLSGPETAQLRRKLREKRVAMHVVKNSIALRILDAAARGTAPLFEGPTALVTGEGEMPEICKSVTEAMKELEEKLTIRGASFEGLVLDAAGVVRLSKIPPRPVLQAQFIGGVQGGIARVASAFQSISRSLACALEGIRKQKETVG